MSPSVPSPSPHLCPPLFTAIGSTLPTRHGRCLQLHRQLPYNMTGQKLNSPVRRIDALYTAASCRLMTGRCSSSSYSTAVCTAAAQVSTSHTRCAWQQFTAKTYIKTCPIYCRASVARTGPATTVAACAHYISTSDQCTHAGSHFTHNSCQLPDGLHALTCAALLHSMNKHSSVWIKSNKRRPYIFGDRDGRKVCEQPCDSHMRRR